MDFYKETKSSSLNYTMLLKYSLTQTDSLAIKSLYIGFLFLAQNRHKLKQIVLIKLYMEFLFHHSSPLSIAIIPPILIINYQSDK